MVSYECDDLLIIHLIAFCRDLIQTEHRRDADDTAFNKSLIGLLEDDNNLYAKKSNGTALIWRNLELDSEDILYTYEEIYKEAAKLKQILEKLGVAKNALVAFTPFESATYCLPAIVIGQV
jgi:hypothetical protein